MEEPSLEVNMPVAELNAIKFSLMTSLDMEKLSSVSIIEMCDVTNAKLGLPNGAPQCATCGSRSVRVCDGHFGVIKLAATVHNPYFIEEFVQLLNQICPGCLTLKQNGDTKVFHMIKKLDPELINQVTRRRELLFLSCLPVTPNCHRVAEMPSGHSDGPGLAFDDRTKAYKRMVDVSRRIDDYRQHPQFSVFAGSVVTSRVMECLKSSKAK